MRFRPFAFALLTLLCAAPLAAGDAENRELLAAAQRQDLERAKQLLEGGADVDARSRYGATPLFFACDKGNLALVELLLERGAEVNVKDTFYQASPLSWALFKAGDSPPHRQVARRLLAAGAEESGPALLAGVEMGDLELVMAAVERGGIEASILSSALAKARAAERAEIAAFLEPRVAAAPPDEGRFEVSPERLEAYAGDYRAAESGYAVQVVLEEGGLSLHAPGQPGLTLVPTAADAFSIAEAPGVTLVFSGRGGLVETFVLSQGGTDTSFVRHDPAAEASASPAPEDERRAAAEEPPAERLPAANWPSFRGPGASGIGDGQGAVTTWDGASRTNVLWATPIPGIALSSPIVWGDRIFVTTAYSEAADPTFRTGLYGDVDSVEDDSVHSFRVYSLDKSSGKILWEREALKARPEVKRHFKSSHANPTPATDGRHLVVSFGSEGLFCYGLDGELHWQKDLGLLSSGWFYDPTYEWGFASSPILHQGRVIVQVDIQEGSFLAAFDAATGKELWRTPRNEIPSWSTPAVLPAADGTGAEIVTNAPTIRGYDAATGKELWQLGPNSEVVVATPVVAGGIAYVTGGYPPARPIYAVKPGGRGDLTLAEEATSSAHVAWSHPRGGTYIPTPIVYRGLIYLLNNNGRLATYDAASGEPVYQERLGRGESFSSSPVAADGRLYFTTEEGRTFVVKAGRSFEVMAENELGEVVMTVPAISDGLLVLRGMQHVYGIAAPPPEAEPTSATMEAPPASER